MTLDFYVFIVDLGYSNLVRFQ